MIRVLVIGGTADLAGKLNAEEATKWLSRVEVEVVETGSTWRKALTELLLAAVEPEVGYVEPRRRRGKGERKRTRKWENYDGR